MSTRKNSRENNTVDQGPQGTPGLTDGEDQNITGASGRTGDSDLGDEKEAGDRTKAGGGEVY